MSVGMLLMPLAHVGHWWTYILYAVPVIIVLGSVVSTLIKERREGKDE
jgi:ABC-type multidrug transport system permease subunit